MNNQTKTMLTHYVYKITNLNPIDSRKYYIGVRTSNCNPEDDTKYMGSSKSLLKSIKEFGKENFSKEILSVWNTREEASNEEIRLHQLYAVSSNNDYYNLTEATSAGFCRFEKVTVLDLRDGTTKDVSKEEFDNCDFYQSLHKDKISVIDNSTGKIKRIALEEYNNGGDFTHLRTGFVPVLDLRDGKTKSVSREDFARFDFYEHHTIGQATVIDLRDGKNKNVSLEDFKLYDFYQSCTKNQVTVLDVRTNKTKNVSKEEFKKK